MTQGHREKCDSGPISDISRLTVLQSCPIASKELIQHTLQKGPITENLSIGDVISIYHKLIFCVLQGWKESEPKWYAIPGTVPPTDSVRKHCDSPHKASHKLAAYFRHCVCSSPKAQGRPLHMERASFYSVNGNGFISLQTGSAWIKITKQNVFTGGDGVTPDAVKSPWEDNVRSLYFMMISVTRPSNDRATGHTLPDSQLCCHFKHTSKIW